MVGSLAAAMKPEAPHLFQISMCAEFERFEVASRLSCVSLAIDAGYARGIGSLHYQQREDLMLRRIAAFLAMVCLVLAVAAPAEADLNSKVKKLNKKVNNLQGQVDALNASWACLRTIPVTQYDGYDYGFDAFLTTALDITEPGGAVGYYVVRDVCGAVPLGRAVARPMQRPN